MQRSTRLLIPIKSTRGAGPNVAAVTSSPLSLDPVLASTTSQSLATAGILELFAAARRIRASLRASASFKPLAGKNMALLSAAAPPSGPTALHRAAQELGIRVARVRFVEAGMPQDVQALARTLGRLYDAIDCDSMPAPMVREIGRHAGVPVYDGLDLDRHPVRVVADLLTLYEHPLPPSTPLSIRLLGDRDASRGRAFMSAAHQIGFDVLSGNALAAAGSDATFVVDATHPQAWPLRTRTGPLDEERRADNHRSVMQALLLDSIARA
ncbi:hypothetical protein QTI66_37055 [Variovorax sp. J22R133]|uniref:hypothetical protein n=1 Tax=Variovorax brevis TaxID=3053503 RepID=UPI002576B23A|nr:hypothetical protein [Variovorax sp. J22R133]MDM0117716.1 hypothetical protein [Variovorax sp. J22R133]